MDNKKILFVLDKGYYVNRNEYSHNKEEAKVFYNQIDLWIVISEHLKENVFLYDIDGNDNLK